VVVAVVLLAVLGVGAWLGSRVLIVKTELEAAQAAVKSVQGGGDTTTAVKSIATHAGTAVLAAHDPVWRVVEGAPYVGDNLRAVRLASESLEELTAQLALPILDAFDSPSDSPVLGRVVPLMESAGPRVGELSRQVAEVQKSPSLVAQVRSGVDQVAQVLDVAAPALELMPRMLGSEGPKNYLMVALNNAELSGPGGVAASQTLIRADHGNITIARQADSSQYKIGAVVDVPLDPSTVDILGDVMLRMPNTAVSRPDFPTAAKLLTAFWKRDIQNDQIDGVFSIDPIALSHVFEATGPITVSTGDKATSDNIVRLLLKDVYARYSDPSKGDVFFKEVATAVFDKVSKGKFDLRKMLSAVQDGIAAGSVMLWSADPDIQKLVATMPVGGILPTDNVAQTMTGVFLRDASDGSKIDYYMKAGITASATCSASGSSEFTTTVKLKLDISKASAIKLPPYVTGNQWGARTYSTEIFVYGPPGTTVTDKKLDSGVRARKTRQDLGRPVTKFTVELKPGETRTFVMTSTGTGGPYGPLTVRTTPMVTPVTVATSGQACSR